MRPILLTLAAAAIAVPAAAQDYHFTKTIASGARVEIENINGAIEVSRATGRVAEVTVTKTVRRGDGSTVIAVMEDDGGGMRVCTVYLGRDPNRKSCNGGNNNGGDSRGRNNVEADMHYVVKVPAGARLTVDDVNGSITVTGGDVDSRINTVNGDINFEGLGAASLETVTGKIVGTFGRAAWEGTMEVQTVNGSVDLAFPADLSAEVSGETVNGSIQSAFPVTIEKGFGPKSFTGRIGAGGRRLKVETVNGSITIRKR